MKKEDNLGLTIDVSKKIETQKKSQTEIELGIKTNLSKLKNLQKVSSVKWFVQKTDYQDLKTMQRNEIVQLMKEN